MVRDVAYLCIVISVAGHLWGCTTTIEPVAPRQPAVVYLIDHGRHATLVLPHPEGMVRYAYGDWEYYALAHNTTWNGIRALLWPTQAALGRRVLRGPPSVSAIRAQLRVGYEQIYRLEVEAAAVEGLRRRLYALFQANRASLIYNSAYDLEFVQYPQTYSFWRNSNHVMAEWLLSLGLKVHGGAYFSRWKVVGPD